jgi:DNA-directed RNA polymerase specialized sigma24 family protein
VRASREAEFTDYVQARLPWLRRVAYLLCQDWQVADDLVQAGITRAVHTLSHTLSGGSLQSHQLRRPLRVRCRDT